MHISSLEPLQLDVVLLGDFFRAAFEKCASPRSGMHDAGVDLVAQQMRTRARRSRDPYRLHLSASESGGPQSAAKRIPFIVSIAVSDRRRERQTDRAVHWKCLGVSVKIETELTSPPQIARVSLLKFAFEQHLVSE